jgi:hypothetical protein
LNSLLDNVTDVSKLIGVSSCSAFVTDLSVHLHSENVVREHIAFSHEDGLLLSLREIFDNPTVLTAILRL